MRFSIMCLFLTVLVKFGPDFASRLKQLIVFLWELLLKSDIVSLLKKSI